MNQAAHNLEREDLVADRYEILQPLGKGGMGSVYQAVDRNLEKQVALKVLDPGLAQNREVCERFKREARTTAAIRHENICDVTDYGVTPQGVPFLVMELLEGETLTSRIKREGQLPLTQTADLILQVLDALAVIHQAGIVHRDLKPDNIFLTRTAKGGDRVKLIDFGIAKVNSATEPLTREGKVMGTAWYMSPEQAEGAIDRIDGRTDLWSTGVICYRMLTGQFPFQGQTLSEVFASILASEPRPPSQIECTLPTELDGVFKKVLAKKPEERFSCAQEFSAALEQALASPRQFVSPTAPGSRQAEKLPVTLRADIDPTPTLDETLKPASSVRPAWSPRRLPQMAAMLAVAVLALGIFIVVELSSSGVAPATSRADRPNLPTPSSPIGQEAGGGGPVEAESPAQPIEITLVGIPEGSAVTFEGRQVLSSQIRGEEGQRGMLEVRVRGYRDLSLEVVLVPGLRLALSDLLEPLPLPPVVTPARGKAPSEAPPLTEPEPQPPPAASPAPAVPGVVGGYEASGNQGVQGGYLEGEKR